MSYCRVTQYCRLRTGGSGNVIEAEMTHDELVKDRPAAKSELDIMLEGILSEVDS